MTLSLPNDIANDTPANAVPVEQNYNFIEDYINREVIVRDGSQAMTSQLLLVGDPTQPLAAAAKQYVDAVLPVGVILPFGGLAAPAGKWAACNGATLQQSEYPKLFSVLGNRYSGTVGAGQFRLPNLMGRIPIGMDPTQTRFDSTGKAGGTWVPPLLQHSHPMPHTHTINHDHSATDSTTATVPGKSSSNAGVFERAMWAGSTGTDAAIELNPHLHEIDAYVGTSGGVSTANTSNAGTANPEHLPPYVVLFYIIRLD